MRTVGRRDTGSYERTLGQEWIFRIKPYKSKSLGSKMGISKSFYSSVQATGGAKRTWCFPPRQEPDKVKYCTVYIIIIDIVIPVDSRVKEKEGKKI